MRTFTATGTRHAYVELGSGDVEVVPTEDDTVSGEITCDDPELEQRMAVDTFGSELRITTPKQDRRFFSRGDTRVRLRVPSGLDLTVATGAGDLTTDVRLGRVSAKSGSGDLRLASTGTARITTGSGDITVLSVDGDADLSSGSGDVRVDLCGADLNVRTTSGDVVIGRLNGTAEAKLASGDFRLAATVGSVSARTGSGDIVVGVAEDLPAWLDLKSGSGDVDIALPPSHEPAPGSRYVSIYARTGSGDISINRA